MTYFFSSSAPEWPYCRQKELEWSDINKVISQVQKTSKWLTETKCFR